MSIIDKIRQDVHDALSGISLPAIHAEKLENVFAKYVHLPDPDEATEHAPSNPAPAAASDAAPAENEAAAETAAEPQEETGQAAAAV